MDYVTLTVGPRQKCNFTAVFQSWKLQSPKNSARQQVHLLYFVVSIQLFPYFHFLSLSSFPLSHDLQKQLIGCIDDTPREQ